VTGSRVVYNGIEMDADWPSRIEAAQAVRTYLIGGIARQRIPYGSEDGGPFSEPCHDCGTLLGQYHVELVCDMEQCPRCGGQVIGCHCPYADEENEEPAVDAAGPSHSASPINWRELRQLIAGEIDGYTLFLETKDGRHVPPDDVASSSQVQDVVALALVWLHDNVPASDTEEPATQLAARLSKRCGLEPVILLSRSTESFVGFYVRVTA
jgi:hypothetical protein